jgi:hypothetical protein
MTVDDCPELEDLPNIGPKTAADFRMMGITKPKQLMGKDPYKLYEQLCQLTGVRQDPCVLDVFIAATRFVGGEPARPWWHYTAERKALAKREQVKTPGAGASRRRV